VFTARYGLSPYAKQIRSVCKELRTIGQRKSEYVSILALGWGPTKVPNSGTRFQRTNTAYLARKTFGIPVTKTHKIFLCFYVHTVNVYSLFVPTNAHTHTQTHICVYIKTLNYIINAPTCFGASALSSGSYDIAFAKVIKCY